MTYSETILWTLREKGGKAVIYAWYVNLVELIQCRLKEILQSITLPYSVTPPSWTASAREKLVSLFLDHMSLQAL